MKIGSYYRYHHDDGIDYIVKLKFKTKNSDGCVYGVHLNFKLYFIIIVGNLELLYTNQYYWNKYATEITEEEAMIESL